MNEARTESERVVALINASPKARKILEAESWSLIIQFELDEPPFYIHIREGQAALKKGTHANPDLLLVGSGASVARACLGKGDFTHCISREEVEIKKGKVMELIRYGRAITAALKEQKTEGK